MVRLKWLKSAKEDLKEIYHYIAFDSKRYAKLQLERIQERTEILKTQVESGKIVEEINDVTIREIIEGNLPRRALRLIQDWTELHKIELIKNYQESQKDNPNFSKINPLE